MRFQWKLCDLKKKKLRLSLQHLVSDLSWEAYLVYTQMLPSEQHVIILVGFYGSSVATADLSLITEI